MQQILKLITFTPTETGFRIILFKQKREHYKKTDVVHKQG